MTILLFIDYFLPGNRHGGPVVTIHNLIQELGETVNFKIVTRNRDQGLTTKYLDISSNIWIDRGKYEVMYLDENFLNLKRFKQLIKETEHDIIYLSSFFSPKFSFSILVSCFLLNYKKKIIISPKGEFSPGALGLKKVKKFTYIKLHNLIFSKLKIIFHASSEDEMRNICSMKFNKRETRVARDIVSLEKHQTTKRKKGPLRLIFLSRIDPMKNLYFVLDVLLGIDFPLTLNIYGTITDHKYWNTCLDLIERMPKNITINYYGNINMTEVQTKFSENDLFLFPTLGENFGHVILESLSSGTCVLLSKNTFWDTTENNSVECLSIDSVEKWRSKIQKISNQNMSDPLSLRQKAYEQFDQYKNTFNKQAIVDNSDLFL